MFNETQQIYEVLNNCQSALITFPENANHDMIASSLALSLILEKMDKRHEIVVPNFNLPKNLNFLPENNRIKKSLDNLRQFIISLDLSNAPLKNLNYKIENNRLNIHLEPETGFYSTEDLRIFNSQFKHDLIITLNTPDLETLNNLYTNYSDFFYQTPILNIDHTAENEFFGHYNLVKVTATSTAEIIYDLIEKIDRNLLDDKIATCLYTGLVDKTKSFKTTQVTPRSLQIASELITIGANRQEIIKNLYQTKSISTLKLWGRILQKLQITDNNKIAWSVAEPDDFSQTQTTADDLNEIFTEMLSNIPTIEISVLFYYLDDKHFALIKAEKNFNLLEILTEYDPQGTKNLVKFKITPELREKIINQLKSII